MVQRGKWETNLYVSNTLWWLHYRPGNKNDWKILLSFCLLIDLTLVVKHYHWQHIGLIQLCLNQRHIFITIQVHQFYVWNQLNVVMLDFTGEWDREIVFKILFPLLYLQIVITLLRRWQEWQGFTGGGGWSERKKVVCIKTNGKFHKELQVKFLDSIFKQNE